MLRCMYTIYGKLGGTSRELVEVGSWVVRKAKSRSRVVTDAETPIIDKMKQLKPNIRERRAT